MDEKVDIVYGLEGFYDEVSASADNQAPGDRPICESLKSIDQRYSDQSPLATGGMKRIFKVFDNRLNRYVALAKLHEQAPSAMHDSFIREARLTGLLEHPNIISVYNIGIGVDDTPFFTMELKIGDNLESVARHQDVSLRFLLEVFVKVCDAIAFAHSKNVLHLDLKPGNIQIGQYGEVKVCDWGLGKVIGDEDNSELDQLLFNPDLLNNMTLAGEVKGTPGYMAPEQIEKSVEKTKLTDVYSLGAVLYCLLTGEAAYSGSVEEVLKKTLISDLHSHSFLSEKWPVPESLVAVVKKAMKANPRERYQSVEELRDDVHHYLSGRTTLAEDAGALKEASLFFKRNKVLCLTTLFFMLALTLFGLSFTDKLQAKNVQLTEQRDQAEKNRLTAIKEKESAQSALKRMVNERGLVRAFIRGEGGDILSIYQNTDVLVFTDPARSLKRAEELLLKIEPFESEYAWGMMQLGYIYFLRQQFSEAVSYFEISSNDPELMKLARDFSEKEKASKLQSVEELVSLWERLSLNKYRLPDAVKMLLYDGQLRSSKDDHLSLLTYLLRRINPQWQSGEASFDEKTGHLKISGEGLVRLGIEKNQLYQTGGGQQERVFLMGSLGVKSLDISKTSFANSQLLLGSDLERLDIRETQIRDIKPLLQMTTLKELIISSGVFPQAQIDLLSQRLKLVIR